MTVNPPSRSNDDQPGKMRRPSFTRRAGWLPHTDANSRDWRRNEQAAADWIRARATVENAQVVVLVNSLSAADRPGTPLGRLIHEVGVTTPQQQQEQWSRTCVLAAYPNAKGLHRSTLIAHDASLAVLESQNFPLAGWAQGADATDLSIVPQKHPELTPEQTEALDRVIFHTGNNNWTGPDDQAFAKRVLGALSGLDADLAIGYVLADAAVSETGAKMLRRVINRVQD